jgi:hypothetical protein
MVKFGHWTVIKSLPPKRRPSGGWIALVKARCDCGTIRTVQFHNMKYGMSKSCGCFRRKSTTLRKTVHGDCRKGAIAPEWSVWQAMIRRCTNPKHPQWQDYGGRGIRVCRRWKRYENFLADMGRRPSAQHSLDRRRVNGNYTPSNCRWATKREQRLNQRKRARLDQFTDHELLGEISRRVDDIKFWIRREKKRDWVPWIHDIMLKQRARHKALTNPLRVVQHH